MKITLDKLPINETAIIEKIDIKGSIKRRLLDLGIIPKTKVKCLFRSPLGDPTAYLIRESVIALRRSDTNKIHIKYNECGEVYEIQ